MSRTIVAKSFAAKILAALLVLLPVCFALPQSRAAAAETASVSSAEELINAVTDDTVSAAAFTVPSVVLSDGLIIDHDMTFTGTQTVLTLEAGAQIKIAAGATVRLDGIELVSTEGYAVSCNGRLIFGSDVTLSGDYGVLLGSGAEATSENRSVTVSSALGRAIGVSPSGGRVTISDLSLSQNSGSTHLIYLHPSSGELLLSGRIVISSNNSNAVMCPNSGSSSPDVVIADSADVTIYAPNARNTGGSSVGGAIDTSKGAVKIGSGAVMNITGSESAILAADIDIGSNAKLILSCPSASGSGSALSSSGALSVGNNAAITVGNDTASDSGGLRSGGDLTLGSGCQLLIRCTDKAKDAVYSGGALTFGDGTSVNIRGGKNGIVTEHGIISGLRCVFDISGTSQCGIRGTGTLIADKLLFGESSTINVSAEQTAIYTKEAFETGKGCSATLSAGSEAPALWVDAEPDAPGYITIVGSNVTISSNAGANAIHNTGVYCVGAVTAEQNSIFFAESSSDFGIMSVNGDINVSSGASMYARSGCGVYAVNGDIRLSSGGSLFSQGTLDSAVRVEDGVINIGENAVADFQGERFGAEVLGSGGLYISGASSFDIRSTVDRAVYIENGCLSIDKVDRVSVWERVDGVKNADTWWESTDMSRTSWELTAADSGIVQKYADHTKLSPTGMQTFRSGEPVDVSSLDWNNAVWETSRYSRIGMYKSKPTARANTFNIPAGKSFSWWLYGESYDDTNFEYTLCSSTGEGEFDLQPNGRFTYTAPAYTRGEQSFMFKITNKEGVSSNPTEIKINVTASKPPIVFSSTFFTDADKPLLATLNLHDYDGAISNTVVSEPPKNGALTMSSDGRFLYTPAENFSGIDSFEFYATDDYGDKSNPGYVTIVVGAKSGIFACNDTYATDSGAAASARLVLADAAHFSTVSASDADSESEIYSGVKFVITKRPEYGFFSVTEDGTVTFDPYDDFAGSDSFRYYAVTADGAQTNEAVVTLAIIPSQRPTVETSYFTCAKNLYCSGKVSAADIDGSISSYELLTEPLYGELTFDPSTGEFRYTPDKDFLGSVSFTFTATDDDGLTSGKATVYIDVLGLFDSLSAAGRLIPVIAASSGILISICVITVLMINHTVKRSRREKLELQEYYRRGY